MSLNDLRNTNFEFARAKLDNVNGGIVTKAYFYAKAIINTLLNKGPIDQLSQKQLNNLITYVYSDIRAFLKKVELDPGLDETEDEFYKYQLPEITLDLTRGAFAESNVKLSDFDEQKKLWMVQQILPDHTIISAEFFEVSNTVCKIIATAKYPKPILDELGKKILAGSVSNLDQQEGWKINTPNDLMLLCTQFPFIIDQQRLWQLIVKSLNDGE